MIPPRAAILLTTAGLVPFLAGAAMVLNLWPGFDGAAGRMLVTSYGVVILCFMSGVLWGFATRGRAIWAYGLSVLPALHMFFFALPHPFSLPGQPLAHLLAGFVVLLVMDIVYVAQGLAPRWWLTLRVPVTAAVMACLWVARYG